MFSLEAAESYQQISRRQRGYGKSLIEDEIKPRPGEAILDLGCGTGELSAYLAELVGQQGKVIAVDPDINRIKLAKECHKGVKNLSFVEGSTSNFPYMGSETYNIVFSNFVLHWVSDKDEAFRNMFSSLKPSGKIAILYCSRLPSSVERAFRELNSQNYDRILNRFHCQTKPVVEEICTSAGFNLLKSYDIKVGDFVFENGESLCSFFWGTTHGVFDRKLVLEETLANFCTRYSRGQHGEIRLRSEENDFYSVLIAVKPAETAEVSTE